MLKGLGSPVFHVFPVAIPAADTAFGGGAYLSLGQAGASHLSALIHQSVKAGERKMTTFLGLYSSWLCSTSDSEAKLCALHKKQSVSASVLGPLERASIFILVSLHWITILSLNASDGGNLTQLTMETRRDRIRGCRIQMEMVNTLGVLTRVRVCWSVGRGRCNPMHLNTTQSDLTFVQT